MVNILLIWDYFFIGLIKKMSARFFNFVAIGIGPFAFTHFDKFLTNQLKSHFHHHEEPLGMAIQKSGYRHQGSAFSYDF